MTVKILFLTVIFYFGGTHASTIVPAWSGCALQVLVAFVKTPATVGYPLPSLTQTTLQQKNRRFVIITTFCYNLLEFI